MIRSFLKLANGRSMAVRSMSTVAASQVRAPKYLVIDGYSEEGRKDLTSFGASTAGALYEKMLAKVSPKGATSKIVYPCDKNFEETLGDLSAYDAVGWTGCSLTIYSGEPRVVKQIDLAKECYRRGIPQFGSCWAIQIAASAAGGTCAKNPRGREMGIGRKIQLNDAGRGHPMYVGKQSVFDAYISHEDEVTHMPPGGVILASNGHSAVQAGVVTHLNGEFWAVQYHPEYDLKELARLTAARIPKLTKMGFFKNEQEAAKYVDELMELYADPSRKDLMWKYGIDADVLDDNIRTMEVRNWVKNQVIPRLI